MKAGSLWDEDWSTRSVGDTVDAIHRRWNNNWTRYIYIYMDCKVYVNAWTGSRYVMTHRLPDLLSTILYENIAVRLPNCWTCGGRNLNLFCTADKIMVNKSEFFSSFGILGWTFLSLFFPIILWVWYMTFNKTKDVSLRYVCFIFANNLMWNFPSF